MNLHKLSLVALSLIIMGAFLSGVLQFGVGGFIAEKGKQTAQTIYGILQPVSTSQGNSSGATTPTIGQTLTSGPEFCYGQNDERDLLYNVETTITTKIDGTKTFESRRRSDGRILRQSFADEQFFITRGVNDTTYNIIPKCGGVDIVYTVKNNTSVPQAAPDFRVDGLVQASDDDFYILDTNNNGNLREVSRPSMSNIFLGGSGGTNLEGVHLDYPDFYYSPVLVSHDNDSVVGTTFMYPYLQYKHGIIPQMTKTTAGLQAGTWRHEYKNTSLNNPGNVIVSQQRTYIISVRFTEPRSWLATIEPYKRYYRLMYGTTQAVRPQDITPVLADYAGSMEYFNAEQNPRSYDPYTYHAPLINEGLEDYVTGHLQNIQQHGFTRTMIWALAGHYAANLNCEVVEPNAQPYMGGQQCNYPPAFMDFPAHIEASSDELLRYKQDGIELGYWWGRAAFVPTPQVWNPSRVNVIDYANPVHVDFADTQLMKAFQKGADVVGLDAFLGEAYDKYTRIDRMKQLTGGSILFIHEGVGPDILHKKIANFYSPSQFTWWTQFDKLQVSGPDVLSRYLNPGSEIWVQDVQGILCDELQDQINWGFTPIIGIFCSDRRVDIDDLEIEQNQCFDRIDNDGDGSFDWPYDRGCLDAKDDTENSDRGNEDPDRLSIVNESIDDGYISGGGGGTTGSSGENEITRRPGQRRILPGASVAELMRQIEQLQWIVNELTYQISLRNAANTYTPPPTGSVPQPTPRPSPTPLPTLPITPVAYNRDLDVGSEGADVAQLQRFLVSRGFLTMSAGSTYGYYGEATREAVARLQLFTGIEPVNGYFGPLTRDRVNQF